MSISLTPLEDKIIVKQAEAETQTASGLFIPDNAKEKPQQGEVRAVVTTPASVSRSTSRSATRCCTPSTAAPRCTTRARITLSSPLVTSWPSSAETSA